MIKPDKVERAKQLLFASEEEFAAAKVATPERQRIMRLRTMYTYWLANPSLRDKAIVDALIEKFGIRVSVAYEDMAYLRICIGDINKTSRQWYQHLFIQRCEEAFEFARRKDDPRAFAAAVAALGKYTRLDRDEKLGPDYSLIVPQQFAITSDPSVAGFERIPNVAERARRLLEKYNIEATPVDAEELPNP